MRVGLVLVALALAGCGADGEPIRPQVNTQVTIGPDGVSTSTGVRIRRGPVSVGVQL